MADLWDERVKEFLRKTGSEFRRFSHDVQEDARRLLKETSDPARKKKLREGLSEVGSWARRAAEEVATVLEEGVKKAETALTKAVREPSPRAPSPPPAGNPAVTPSSLRPRPTLGAPPAARPQGMEGAGKVGKVEKSVGPGGHPSRRSASLRPKAAAKKTLGRRERGGDGEE